MADLDWRCDCGAVQGTTSAPRSAAAGSLALILRSVRRMLRWWRRDGTGSPLRDAAGAPIVAPRVLSADALARARQPA
ncbi:MAG: hypothetical protein R3F59_12410 [Myxococcota bacterium]